MKKLFLTLTTIIFALSANSQGLVGTWNGTLSVQGHNLRIVFNITKDGDTYSATMDSPDQGATGLPVTSITLEDNRVRMSISIPNAPPAEYIGELSENTITGTFRQMGMTFPLNLARAGAEEGSTRGFLRGRLFDSQTREPLMFASVALLADADSSLLTGVITDEDGRFLLENLRYGHYRLRVSNVGYHTFVSETIELRRGNNRLDMGSFFINPSTIELAGVEIIAAVPLLEQRAGRLVFNVSESTTSVGDNALETLRKFPGVTVDNDDNILLNGQPVLVMIDNRETHLSGDQLANLLRTMPAEQIGSIEGLDNPGARFSAEGIAGILNIRTRRTRMIGYSGTVFAGAGYNRDFSHNQGFDINFRNNSITAFANLSHSRRNGSAGMDGFTDFPNGMRREINRGEDRQREEWSFSNPHHSLSGRAGIDYHINTRNILSFSYRFMQGGNMNDGNLYSRMMDSTRTVLSSFSQHIYNDNNWGNHNLSLNYQHIFDSANQRQFFIDASWVRNYLRGGGYLEMVNRSGDFGAITGIEPQNLNVRLPSDIFSARFDLELPINRETRIETGVRYSFVNNDNNQIFLVEGDTNWGMTNRYIYSEHISAAYVQINHTFSPRLSIEAGLRFEHTALSGDLRRNLRTSDSV
ncbi:MAG: outer membrane beta-barrel protein, partial [Bacteroidales bacterium]|nr:outer membrane beta-barrel protein [Bacteroidales bacterium]